MGLSMRMPFKFRAILVVSLSLCGLLVSAPTSFAKLTAAGNYCEGILDAELVAIVVQSSPGSFRVEETFLGNAKEGDSIDLPGFRLFTEEAYGPDLIDPITPDTRILLYLRHSKDSPRNWQITDKGYAFFWVQSPEKTPQLRDTAQKGIALRRQWEAAVTISDPASRAEALWPFVVAQNYGVDISEHTKTALRKIAPISGDYFAKQFDSMPTRDRMDLFREAGAYGGEKLHRKLTSFIEMQQEIYENYAIAHNLSGNEAPNVWSLLPLAVQDSSGNVYYGVAGLASYKRRDDLPLIRKIARWAVKFGQQDTCDAVLDALKAMPDQVNLTVISLIAQKFRNTDDATFPIDVMSSLCAHKYVATIPLLAPFVSPDGFGEQAEAALTEIVGQDLGNKPAPWLAWYKTKVAKTVATRPPGVDISCAELCSRKS